MQNQNPSDVLIKSEPPDCHTLQNHNKKDCERENVVDEHSTGEDSIESKRREIVENETTVYKCQDCDEVFQKFADYKFHRAQHSIERRTCKICHLLCQGITKV